MSSPSNIHSRHDPTPASSSKSPYQAATVTEEDDRDAFEDQDVTDDLLASDPLDGSLDKQ